MSDLIKQRQKVKKLLEDINNGFSSLFITAGTFTDGVMQQGQTFLLFKEDPQLKEQLEEIAQILRMHVTSQASSLSYKITKIKDRLWAGDDI